VGQTEDHTCGFCALSAIYKHYGLDPREYRLRELLGTDSHPLPYLMPFRDKLNAWMSAKNLDSKGTLPMDVFAVLHWHGFVKDWKAPYEDGQKAALRAHLKAGHPALALSRPLDHWVVITGIDDDGVWIADSSGHLDPRRRGRKNYRIKHEAAPGRFSGIILVKRHKLARMREMTYLDFAREYADGTRFGAACLGIALPVWIRKLLER
jgi:ABC-type bacteriocin/lantibiotic exporter with double-glycine peptidase domain